MSRAYSKTVSEALGPGIWSLLKCSPRSLPPHSPPFPHPQHLAPRSLSSANSSGREVGQAQFPRELPSPALPFCPSVCNARPQHPASTPSLAGLVLAGDQGHSWGERDFKTGLATASPLRTGLRNKDHGFGWGTGCCFLRSDIHRLGVWVLTPWQFGG